MDIKNIEKLKETEYGRELIEDIISLGEAKKIMENPFSAVFHNDFNDFKLNDDIKAYLTNKLIIECYKKTSRVLYHRTMLEMVKDIRLFYPITTERFREKISGGAYDFEDFIIKYYLKPYCDAFRETQQETLILENYCLLTDDKINKIQKVFLKE